jgi:outer membrane protein OmpA-like peptidoglycan-associated protein
MEKIKVNRFIMIGILFLMGISLVLTGCAGMTAQEKERGMNAVNKAKVALEEAKANPEVASAASVTLYEAEQLLQEAENVTDDILKKEHLAYMSERKTQLAVASAERATAEKETLNLSRERDQLLLKLREKEIGRVQATVQQREKEAKLAQELAATKQAELERLRSELEEMKARPTDRGMVLTLGDVLFETNRSTLLPGAEKNIEQLSQFMNKYPDRKIVVEGHTDSRGSAEYNMLLSKRRADSVKNALVEKGIDESRIHDEGLRRNPPDSQQ